MYRRFFKRFIDICVSAVGIVLLIPLFAIIIILIKCDSKGPILFKQKRVGIHKSHFYILKFRTMSIDTPNNCPTHLLQNPEQYISRVGRVLRKTSLDELPQVFNIFSGKMSIIGPRPALWNQFDLIAEREKYGANDLRPGLTGLAQISGRDELDIATKARFDGEYAQNMSLAFDLKCFFGTLVSVFKKEGIVEGCDNNQTIEVGSEQPAREKTTVG